MQSNFRLLIALGSMLAVGISTGAAAEAETPKEEVKKVTGLRNPESAVGHLDGRIFVSEIGEFDKDGDGKITVIMPDGGKEVLAGGLDDPKGIDLWNDTLYVADKTRVMKITLDGKTSVFADAEDFPNRPEFLNDIEIDDEGNVYVSDSGKEDGTGSGIYRIDQDGEVTRILAEKRGIQRPNGLLLDGINALLVADFGTGELFRLDLIRGKVIDLNSGLGGTDGLVRDSRGYLYVSDWKGGKVWRLVEPSSPPQLMKTDYQSAADIALAPDGRYLLVPDMKAGELHFLSVW
ncbi:SMP-30/gluconolactonase/LRE family protein [Methylohalobius crimeensis]|uniref:SMP-30/gluconolactonase/LRE family protein n=1 Tax=Methylohalobius crimeensis TaxID=244365 RepID=UPI0003B5EC67|nr:SMP-30/gluconolactonase/LRE family protein [Methylohalobius crimeensis]